MDLLDHLGHLAYYEAWQRNVIKQTIVTWQKQREKLAHIQKIARKIERINSSYTKNSSSCIDLNFTDQSNMSVNYGVHASLHSTCHHQIVHASFNLYITYLPPISTSDVGLQKG